MMPSKVDIVADRGGPKYYEAVVRELVSCLIKHDDFRKYLSSQCHAIIRLSTYSKDSFNNI